MGLRARLPPCGLLLVLLPFAVASAGAQESLSSFASDQELERFIKSLPRRPAMGFGELDEIIVTGSRVRESITNTQTEGVDEGGIVKVHGDHLVVLRRGRVFTVSIADEELTPVSWVDAYGPNMEPDSTWYDEMLVHDDRVIVIGYSYERGGTEVALFDIDDAGRLRHDATYHLRSDDYYSSRNYASRLVDGKLILYSPLPLVDMDSLPAIRRWPQFVPKDVELFEDAGFTRIAPASSIFRIRSLRTLEEAVLHTITTCDLRSRDLQCAATGVIGTYSEVFYVSESAVYVWTELDRQRTNERIGTSIVYRLPLDGSRPTALSAFGNPVDQFSFLEHDGYLNVLVSSLSTGNWMWSAEKYPGDIALLRTPVSSFGGMAAPVESDYRALPLEDDGGALRNRFGHGRLFYGLESTPEVDGRGSTLYITDIELGATSEIALDHSVERIELTETGAVAIGIDASENLHFSGIDISEGARRQHFALQGAQQGELRSHGFFYAADSAGRDVGTLGLPVRSGDESGWKHLRENSAGVLFLRDTGTDFRELGVLYSEAESEDDEDDGCEASCVDWYGNARPIFLRGRVFALLGYELVEGEVRNSRVREVQRVDFMPYIPF